jgi:hypothetical protein
VKLDTLPLKPSLTGEVAARQTGGSGGTEELKWSVGLSLGEFLFPGSKLEARYGEYRASNVASILVGATNRPLTRRTIASTRTAVPSAAPWPAST